MSDQIKYIVHAHPSYLVGANPQGIPKQGPMGPRGYRGSPGPECPCSHITVSNRISELELSIKEMTENITELTEALNESRDQIQALLDYCFVDKTRWNQKT